MTIDEAIIYLRALKRCETCEEGEIGRCRSCSCYRIGGSAKCYDAIDVGVETMHKYQKIEQIIKDWEDGRFNDDVGCLRVKVVLDGNDN